MEEVTINTLVKLQPLNEEQVLDEKLVLLLLEELVGFVEERRTWRTNKEIILIIVYDVLWKIKY
jgi:hypothetical protein